MLSLDRIYLLRPLLIEEVLLKIICAPLKLKLRYTPQVDLILKCVTNTVYLILKENSEFNQKVNFRNCRLLYEERNYNILIGMDGNGEGT